MSSQDLVSVTAIATRAKKPVRDIETVVAVMGMKPALRLDQVAYLNEKQIELVMAKFAREDK